jgi:hypothetical protein
MKKKKPAIAVKLPPVGKIIGFKPKISGTLNIHKPPRFTGKA